MLRIVIAISIISVLTVPRSFAEAFSENSKWGEIKAASYSATLYKNGQYKIDVEGLMKFNASFIQRWEFFQSFPEIKLLKASLLTNKKDVSISVFFDYFWNDGQVKEQLDFSPYSITASYSYTPCQKKNVSMFTCLFKATAPVNAEGLKLTGMQRHDELSGALDQIGKWRNITAGMKMISIGGAGDYVVNLIAVDRAWLNIWAWPLIGISNNGNYPKWDNVIYKNGEEYKVKYVISIVEKIEKLAKHPSVTFTDTNKE
ncbi:MAG: hypothetical protein A2020_07855 [Lentisphaerae bacterium GWF2_45_14]|nr:MAG: hypothetical protein A2020_07855 [Lentisphaerae bacterium GWF2_45_14]